MIAEANEIYEKVAKDNNLDLEIVKSIGNAAFLELRENLNSPTKLSYELPKFGTFNIKFKDVQKYYKTVMRQLEENNESLLKRIEKNPAYVDNIASLNSQIEDYKENKQKKRDERYGNKPSEDNAS